MTVSDPVSEGYQTMNGHDGQTSFPAVFERATSPDGLYEAVCETLICLAQLLWVEFSSRCARGLHVG